MNDKPPAVLHRRWRTGRKLGRTIYAMLDEEASDNDVLIGMFDSPVVAEATVKLHNEWLEEREDG